MRPSKKLLASFFAVLITGSALAVTAEAGRYGPTGLGPNLHRRFIIKQAQKNVRRGKPVTGRAIIWQTRPSTSVYRAVPGWRRW